MEFQSTINNVYIVSRKYIWISHRRLFSTDFRLQPSLSSPSVRSNVVFMFGPDQVLRQKQARTRSTEDENLRDNSDDILTASPHLTSPLASDGSARTHRMPPSPTRHPRTPPCSSFCCCCCCCRWGCRRAYSSKSPSNKE